MLPFHKNFELFSHVIQVALERQFVLQRYHPVETVYLHFFRNIVGHLARSWRRARALRNT